MSRADAVHGRRTQAHERFVHARQGQHQGCPRRREAVILQAHDEVLDGCRYGLREALIGPVGQCYTRTSRTTLSARRRIKNRGIVADSNTDIVTRRTQRAQMAGDECELASG